MALSSSPINTEYSTPKFGASFGIESDRRNPVLECAWDSPQLLWKIVFKESQAGSRKGFFSVTLSNVFNMLELSKHLIESSLHKSIVWPQPYFMLVAKRLVQIFQVLKPLDCAWTLALWLVSVTLEPWLFPGNCFQILVILDKTSVCSSGKNLLPSFWLGKVNELFPTTNSHMRRKLSI